MITFKKFKNSDIDILYIWLNKDHVKRFWYPDCEYSFEEIHAKYSKKLMNDDTNMFIIVIDDIEVGFIQSYIVDDPKLFNSTEEMVGIDLFIGDINYIKKGNGPLVIREFIDSVISKNIKFVGIDPEVSNVFAIKCYKKVGFKHIKTEFSNTEKKMTYYKVNERKI